MKKAILLAALILASVAVLADGSDPLHLCGPHHNQVCPPTAK